VKKLLYVDTETTGLVAGHHAIIQLAYIIEIDGKVTKRGSYKINPKTYNHKVYVSPKALECNGYRVEDFDRFVHGIKMLRRLGVMLAIRLVAI